MRRPHGMTKLYLDILDEPRQQVFARLTLFTPQWTLGGGTALALQIGHRKSYDFDLFSIPRIDILDEIEELTGKRIGLDLLAQTNLGVGKTGHGLEAASLYKEGKIDELKKYCINDVKITRELYDLAKSQGHLMVPQRSRPQPLKVSFDWREKLLYQRLF